MTLIGVAFAMKGGVLIIIPEASMKSNQMTRNILPLVEGDFIAAGLHLGWVSYVAV